jgi:hypothetical protein
MADKLGSDPSTEMCGGSSPPKRTKHASPIVAIGLRCLVLCEAFTKLLTIATSAGEFRGSSPLWHVYFYNRSLRFTSLSYRHWRKTRNVAND